MQCPLSPLENMCSWSQAFDICGCKPWFVRSCCAYTAGTATHVEKDRHEWRNSSILKASGELETYRCWCGLLMIVEDFGEIRSENSGAWGLIQTTYISRVRKLWVRQQPHLDLSQKRVTLYLQQARDNIRAWSILSRPLHGLEPDLIRLKVFKCSRRCTIRKKSRFFIEDWLRYRSCHELQVKGFWKQTKVDCWVIWSQSRNRNIRLEVCPFDKVL